MARGSRERETEGRAEEEGARGGQGQETCSAFRKRKLRRRRGAASEFGQECCWHGHRWSHGQSRCPSKSRNEPSNGVLRQRWFEESIYAC